MISTGVRINKMHLMGDINHKNAFLHSLDNQTWHGEESHKIIFIDKIVVEGKWWEVASKIVQEANKIGEQSVNHVVFNSYAKMVSHFIQMLLKGIKPWYLESWLQQEQLSALPIAVLTHKIDQIPSVLNELQTSQSNSNNALADVFISFKLPELQRLLQALTPMSPVLGDFQQYPFDHDSTPKVIKSIIPLSAQKWIGEYLIATVHRTMSQTEISNILMIVSCLSGWRFAPNVLQNIESFRIWFGQVNKIYQESFHPPLTPPLARGRDSVSYLSVSNENLASSHDVVSITSLSQTSTDSPSPLPRGRLGGGKDLPQYVIHQAGLLFLINLLKSNQSLYSSFLLDEHPNPWVLLHQVFVKIADEFSFSLESSFGELLIDISALAVDEFLEQAGKSNSSVDDIYSQLKQRLQKMNLWFSDWFFITARVEVDQAYISAYLDNSAVRLDIRSAGLDINPGWVPGFGRVIYFHYGSYPELQLKGKQ